MIDIRMHTF